MHNTNQFGFFTYVYSFVSNNNEQRTTGIFAIKVSLSLKTNKQKFSPKVPLKVVRLLFPC